MSLSSNFSGGVAKQFERVATAFKDASMTGFDKGLIGFVIVVAIVAFIITIVYVNIRVKRNQIAECNNNVSAFNSLLSTLQGASTTQPPATPPATK
jgi:cell division protein FtsL